MGALRWLGSEERCDVPRVYIEARSLAELPTRASEVLGEPAGERPRLRAGAARVEITPSGSVTMRGFERRQSTGVHDRLHERVGILPSSILVNCTHTHSDGVGEAVGGEAVALFLQGCAGDTATHAFRKGRTVPEAERLGAKLAEEAEGILKRIDVVPWVPLSGTNRTIHLPQWEPQTPEDGTTMPAVPGDRIRDEIQALVIGDCLILAVGSMEPYVEIGLDIKEASRFRHTFVLGYSNGPWLGYLPSNWAYSVNDPDVKGTRYAPEAPDVLVEACLKLHTEVWNSQRKA